MNWPATSDPNIICLRSYFNVIAATFSPLLWEKQQQITEFTCPQTELHPWFGRFQSHRQQHPSTVKENVRKTKYLTAFVSKNNNWVHLPINRAAPMIWMFLEPQPTASVCYQRNCKTGYLPSRSMTMSALFMCSMLCSLKMEPSRSNDDGGGGVILDAGISLGKKMQ